MKRYKSNWQAEVAKVIIEIVDARDPLSRYEFTGEDLLDKKARFHKLYGNSNKNLENTVRNVLQILRDKGAIEFLGAIPDTPYHKYCITDREILEHISNPIASIPKRKSIVKRLYNHTLKP